MAVRNCAGSLFAVAVLVAAGFFLCPPAEAKGSLAYECPYLGDPTRQTLEPMTQGQQGWFFRKTDFRENFEVLPDTAKYMARLATAFKKQGAQLMIMPVPPRIMGAIKYTVKDQQFQNSYDLEAAKASFAGFLKQIEDTGVTVVDLRDVSLSETDKQHFFFKRDVHWTTYGANLAAKRVGETVRKMPDHNTTGEAKYHSEQIDSDLLESKMALEIQQLCKSTVPLEEMPGFTTTLVSSGAAGEDALFGDSTAEKMIVLGSSYSAGEKFNFAGFLSEFSGMEVANFAISGGQLFNAIISYTSLPEAERLHPRVVLWEALSHYDFNEGGSKFRQLIPAIYGECKKENAVLSREFHLDGNTQPLILQVPKEKNIQGKKYFLFINTSSKDVVKFTLDLDHADGDGEWITIDRTDHFTSTGRFFLELNDELSAPLTSVTISNMPEARGTMEVRLCQSPEGEEEAAEVPTKTTTTATP